MTDLDLDAIRHSVGVTHSEVSALCSHVDDLLAEVERLKANQPDGGERSRIVAWLRAEAEEFERLKPRGIEAAVYAYIADAIERGEAAE